MQLIGLAFSNIIWAADTNYRVSLPNEQARSLAESDAYAELLEADQVRLRGQSGTHRLTLTDHAH